MSHMSLPAATIQTATRRDRFGRTEVFANGKLVGRILPKNCGTWAACKTGAEVSYHDTFRQAVSAITA